MDISDSDALTCSSVDEEPPPSSFSSTTLVSLGPPQFAPIPAAEPIPLEPSYPPPGLRNQYLRAARARRGNTKTRAFRRRFFPDVSDSDWNDWRWQSRHR